MPDKKNSININEDENELKEKLYGRENDIEDEYYDYKTNYQHLQDDNQDIQIIEYKKD